MKKLVGFALLALTACGGGAKPANTPEQANEASVLADEPAPGAVAPASSADVERAIEAIKASDFATAKKLLTEATAANPKDAQAAFYLGVAESGLGETGPAVEHLRQALKLDPGLLEASLNLSAILLDAGKAQEALDAAELGLKRAPSDDGLLQNKAMALAALSEWARAVEVYALVAQKHPGDEGLQFLYGEALASAGKTEEASKQLLPLTKSDKPEVLASTADQLGRLKQWDGCIAALDRAIAKKEAGELFLKRGLCQHGKKDEAAAKADFQKAVALEPKSAKAYFYLAQSLVASGDKKAAKKAFAKVLELDPNGPFAKAAKAATTK